MNYFAFNERVYCPCCPVCACTRGWSADSSAKPLAHIQAHRHSWLLLRFSREREQEPSTRGEERGDGASRRGAQHADSGVGVGGCEVIFHHRVHFSTAEFSHSEHGSISLYLSSPPLIPLCLSLSSLIPLFSCSLSLSFPCSLPKLCVSPLSLFQPSFSL